MMRNKFKAIALIMTPVLFFHNALGIQLPKAYENLDHRNSYVYHEKNNIIKVNCSLGFITSLIFPKGEEINNLIVGIEEGWAIQHTSDTVFIKPVVAVDKNGSSEDINEAVLTPNNNDWKTNLIVLTNKSYYQFELNYVDNESDINLKVNITNIKPKEDYTEEELKEKNRQKALAIKRAKEKEKANHLKSIEEAQKKAVSILPTPSSWNYTYKLGKDSKIIEPNFTYDDGKFIYIGFKDKQPLPRPYIVRNGKETLVDNNVIRENDLTILVIKSLPSKLKLRYENKVVEVNSYE